MEWYERYPMRLMAEMEILGDRFPQFVLKMDNGALFWDGLLQTNFDTLYRANIIYPSSYPWQKPKLRIIEPSLRGDAPHRFADSSLCVFPKEWDYKRCTAPAAVPLVAVWLFLYEFFLRTGERW